MNRDLPFHAHNPSSTNMKEGDHMSPGTAAGLRIIDVCSLQARRDRTDAESGTRLIHSEPQISPPADHVDTDLSDYIMKVKVESQLFDGISSEDCREDIQIKPEEMDGVTIKGEKDLGKAECIQSIVPSTSIEALSRVSMKEEAYDVENEANYVAERTVEYVRQFPCTRCTQSFHTEIDLHMHMERHPQSPSYSRHKCSYCHYSSDSSGNLRTHLRIHTGERPYECSICGKTFAQLGHVKAHNLNHTGQRPYKCSLCDKSFVSASHRKRHMMSHTGERPYKCSVCPKAFVQFNTLNTHMRIHTGERPYKCTVCDRAFTQESGIRIHFKSHTGDRPHKCSVCGKAFVEARYLKTHMTVHTQDRPYKCSVCGKSFSQNAHVNEHMSVHTGHRPHNCSICGKTFRTLSNARKHMRVHTKDRPYKCTVCAKTFSRMSHVCKHMKTHSDEFTLAQAPSVP